MIRVQHSAIGKIKKLLMVYDRKKESLAFILEMSKILQDHTEVVVWLNFKEDQAAIESKIKNVRKNYSIVTSSGVNVKISSWIRDVFLINNNGRNNLIPLGPEVENIAMYEILRKNNHIGSIQVVRGISQEGLRAGNFLIGENYVLVDISDFPKGTNTDALRQIFRKALFPSLTQNQADIFFYCTICLENQHESILKNRIAIENESRIFLHADQFITITGAKYKGKDVLFLAETKALTVRAKSAEIRFNSWLNEVEKFLSSTKKIYVIRNYVPIFTFGNSSSSYVGYYNNCLVEYIEDGQKNVYLPSYIKGAGNLQSKVRVIEEQNIDLWKCWDFDVHLIKNVPFNKFARRRGAIHCLTNELLRI